MFKWMISGHRGPKMKNGKYMNGSSSPLNNKKSKTKLNVQPNSSIEADDESNNNTGETTPRTFDEIHQHNAAIAMQQKKNMRNSRDNLNDSYEYTTLEQLQTRVSTSAIDKSLEQLNQIGNFSALHHAE